jgi:outer membrane protein OmpA-like peptidoglycan-associated protein
MRLHQIIVPGAVAVWLMAAPASAQMPGSPSAVPSEAEISRSLAPQPQMQTRGIPKIGTAGMQPNPAISSAAAHPSATFNTIQFEFGSARLTPDSIETLKNLGNALNHALKDQQHFRIEGHTDARGAAAYNDELSRQRAQAVLDYLEQQMGVAGTRLQAVGKGSSEPVGGSDPNAGINRRVVVVNLEG